jgi:tetrahydromethanopterin S-methyltransferase subunit A
MNEKVTNKGIERFRDELELLRRYLGEDYLERIEKRIKDFHSQIIIAIENINAEV